MKIGKRPTRRWTGASAFRQRMDNWLGTSMRTMLYANLYDKLDDVLHPQLRFRVVVHFYHLDTEYQRANR